MADLLFLDTCALQIFATVKVYELHNVLWNNNDLQTLGKKILCSQSACGACDLEQTSPALLCSVWGSSLLPPGPVLSADLLVSHSLLYFPPHPVPWVSDCSLPWLKVDVWFFIHSRSKFRQQRIYWAFQLPGYSFLLWSYCLLWRAMQSLQLPLHLTALQLCLLPTPKKSLSVGIFYGLP